MWCKSLLFLAAAVTPLVWAQRVRLDAAVAVPLHYNIETTIDSANKKFTSQGSIEINLLVDSNEIPFLVNGLKSDWDKAFLTTENGQTLKPKRFIKEAGGHYMALFFEEAVKGGAKYTIHFSGVEGQLALGSGLAEIVSATK